VPEGPTLNGFAPFSFFETVSRIRASQAALPEDLTSGQAGLPMAYRVLPAAGRVLAGAPAAGVVAAVAEAAVIAVIAEPATAAPTAATVSQ
jgi:hypothetical protein